MASTVREIAEEIPNVIKVYKDGTVERLIVHDYYVPPSTDSGVMSKDITISEIPAISARLYLPQNQNRKLPVLVYFHAGAFCVSSALSFFHHRYLNRLVSEAQVVAVSVEYRLAPENLLPAAYEDCWTALQWVASHSRNEDNEGAKKEAWLVSYGDFERLYIGGDSAGGNIAHNIAMRAGVENLHEGVKILGAIVSHAYFWGSKPIGSEPKPEFYSLANKVWNLFYPSADGGTDNPMVNPAGLGAPSLAGLACSKLLVCVAGKDDLRDRNIWYYELVKESGWKGKLELFEMEEEGHCFHISDEGSVENRKKMIERLACFMI
ncbi:2-hydroxyisoflavanone dehydratase-like [Argentina anserina]|uniref:2-hydroxyisoflavanone dehydratase-like n=1 Tax=Argentina anserina TaxID=57926 RepID=UPI0021763F10|nr:2-hydroxyisoflavanone dehydratase-like [Potentilla anserina]